MSTQMLRDELDQVGSPLRSTTQFHALVRLGESDDIQAWQARLEQVTHLGGARSRGLGQVSVKAESVPLFTLSPRDLALAPEALAKGQAQNVEKPSYEMNMAERIQAFTQAVYKITRNAAPEYWYFTVNLHSDLIPGDVHGPRWQLEANDFGFPGAVERVWSFARYTRAGGWSSAWGLPKPLAPALEAGSVFVFRVPTGDQALAEKVLQRCAALESTSMGQRREEGFGAIQICTPFHFETEVRK
jgi:CRISPR-associated Csx10 family RAMP protein